MFTIRERMYFELHVDTEDRRLAIFALDCFATPSQDRNALPRYDVIKDGYVSHTYSSVSGGPPAPYQSPKGIIMIYLVYVCFWSIYYSLWWPKQGNFVYMLFPDAPLITQWNSTTRSTHKSSVLAWKPSSMSANTLTCLCTVELKSATPRIQTQGALEAAWNVSLEALKRSMKRLTTCILWPKDRLLWIERRE